MPEARYTERVVRLPPSEAMAPSGTDYALRVFVLGGKPERFVFDQPRLVVGRGHDADLRIEHACIARAQFAIERSTGSAGEPRFRIVPNEAATNPTFVNERPAVEGTLMPGDLVAVGEVRVVLENRVKKAEARRAAAEAPDVLGEKQGPSMPPLRMVLLGLTVVMALAVTYLVFFEEEEEGAGDLMATQTPLFGRLREPHCANPMECDTKAHEAYDRGRKLTATAAADPGNLYRATLEFARARSYREQSGRPLGDMADVEQRYTNTRRDAEAAFDDARFALKRAIAAKDVRRAGAAAAHLARLVPDEDHPYRAKLDAYRRTLPRPKEKSSAASGDL